LTDGTELVGAATDPELGYGRNSLPGLVNLLPSGDGNSDGVPDVNQAAVSTFTHTTRYGLRTITLATYSEETADFASGETKAYLGTGSDLADVETVATTARAVRIGGVRYDLDYGISFSASTDVGQLEQFELILEGSSASQVALVKQVCDEDSVAFGEWRVLDSTPEPFGAGRFRLTWDITEGGDFDCNGDGGGIADPAYIATWDAVEVPTMPWFMVAGLSGLTALGGLLRLRRRRKVMGPRSA
jgi:LPXTG-motif cell wall-anchored protein